MQKIITITLICILIAFSQSCRKSDYSLPQEAGVISDQGEGTGTLTWKKGEEIILQGFVFVNDGQTLTIEAGAVIKFKEGQGATASALIVARGGTIIANGTPEEPIIFTSELDPLDGSLPKDSFGLWGGLIILGDAPLNTSTGEAFIEGIPNSEPRALFGGTDPEDSSGEISYVSIRYPGTILNEGNEINGLTLGGVGVNTKIDHIEIINSADDGIEIFGGNVNIRHAICLNAHDDIIDFELGYQGNIQFVLGLQKEQVGDNIMEANGGLDPVFSLPISRPTIANATFIGNSRTSNSCITYANFAAGITANSIFYNTSSGVRNEYFDGQTDSYSQWEREVLKIESNIFYNVAGNIENDMFHLYGGQINEEAINLWKAYFNGGSNEILDLGLSLDGNVKLAPDIPTDNNLYPLNDWFEVTNYKGAIGTYDWTDGWTIYKEFIQD
jgi:hypothetical protein